ncbi:MAG TPA: pyridoxamine 5'-phosphate oxidase family protein [Chitinophagaceae bacterium]|jgi:predicted pyridoxine 5'-phosphate oxidase superfamily flavin-nucleotide-binding protein|nr:pyridoxamine 5'-phosphate oxidase family protein [Chitinophagaceae bacterium]
MVTDEVREGINQSILCWLATCSSSGEPNVSPKEIFHIWDRTTLLIANIASPQSIGNIESNPNVCVAFVDIFVQKGYKLKGVASIIKRENPSYNIYVQPLSSLAGERYPIKSVIAVEVLKVERVLAPSYRLYPETTEASQIASAMKSYKVRPM